LRAAYEWFRDVPVGSLSVQEPITLIESGYYADGGSVDFRFRDAKGEEFVAVKLSTYSHPPERCRNYLFGPADTSWERLPELPAGSEPEQALCGLLVRWAKVDPSFWLLLWADRDAISAWHSWINSPAAHERQGKGSYTNNRGLAFTLYLLRTAASRIDSGTES
jgi:hypothetical protein